MEKMFNVNDFVFGDYIRVAESSNGWKYCTALNNAIKSFVLQQGHRFTSLSFAGDIYEFNEQGVHLTYRNSDYGNDSYRIDIHEIVWNEVPREVAHIVNEDGWNCVYSVLDKTDRMLVNVNVPGTWCSLFGIEINGSDVVLKHK